jgi:hypothetical protein
MAPKVFGEDSSKLLAFSEPEQTDFDNFAMADHVGAVVVVKVGGIEAITTKAYGDKPAARLDVRVIDRKAKKIAHEFSDVLVFSAAVVKQVEQYARGDEFVAEVAVYKSKFGTNGYKFDAPATADIAAAAVALDTATAEPPF